MSELSPVFRLADRYVTQRIALDPDEATALGVPGYDHLLTDPSPAAADERNALDAAALTELEQLPAGLQTERDRIAAAFMRDRLSTRLALHDAGEHLRHLSVLSSPITNVRLIFTLMPTGTDDDWRNIAARMEQIPSTLLGAIQALELGLERDLPAQRRQVVGVARTCRVIAGQETDGCQAAEPWFRGLAQAYEGRDSSLSRRLLAAAEQGSAAFGDTAQWLETRYLPRSQPADGVGAQRYAGFTRLWLGMQPDLAETYEWGWSELDRITRRAREIAGAVLGGAGLAQASAYLDADPRFQVHGTDALRAWLQDFTDQAMNEVARTCFDIPPEIRRCEAMIAPPGGAAAMYYTPPSEDFARPGRTWYPTQGKDTFAIWSAVATWYHESVPGHHLQIAYAMLQREQLSRLQRAEFIAGHAEGWALYAERLMGELGFYSEPAYELGMLAGQALRAARVVIDIGLHLNLALPDHPLSRNVNGFDAAGRTWTRDLAVDFLIGHAMQSADFAASEVDRYLGLPAQAISYKLGERAWLRARAAAQSRTGEAFDLRAWHMHALGLGPLGLDDLVRELSHWNPGT